MIDSKRLVFRELEFADLSKLREIFGDPEIMTYSVDGIKSDAGILNYIEENRIRYPEETGQWGLYLKATGAFVGIAGYFDFHYEQDLDLEISYRLKKVFWGQGLATEAARHLVEYALVQLKRPRVFGIVDQRNEASRRVLEKAGLCLMDTFEYHGRQTYLYQVERKKIDKPEATLERRQLK